VEGGGGLVVLQPLHYRAINHNLMVLQLSADHSEGVVDYMMVDVNLAETVAGSCRDPLLVHVVVDHDAGARGGDALLRTLLTHDETGYFFLLGKCQLATDSF